MCYFISKTKLQVKIILLFRPIKVFQLRMIFISIAEFGEFAHSRNTRKGLSLELIFHITTHGFAFRHLTFYRPLT